MGSGCFSEIPNPRLNGCPGLAKSNARVREPYSHHAVGIEYEIILKDEVRIG